jgi:undecaprenyl-diphosphatase
LLWLVLMAGVIALLGVAATHTGALPRVDNLVIENLRDHPGLTAGTRLAVLVSAVGGIQVAFALAAGATVVLAALRHWQGVLMVVLSVTAAQFIVPAIKVVVGRPRPDAEDQLVHVGGFSFPSGHSATSMAVYATLAFLLIQALDHGGLRVAVGLAGAALVFAIGLSRVFLGVHYPSDVLAGWLTGGVFVLGSWGLVRLLGIQPPPRATGSRPAPG